MKPLKLEDLKPEPGKFYLKKFDREFTVRLPTLEDEAWLSQAFGDQAQVELQKVEGMCRFVYRLLSEEDKGFFMSTTREEIDEDGVKRAVTTGGWKAFMASVESMSEKVLMARALVRTRGLSAPVLDEIVQEEIKKKEKAANQLKRSAGEPSLTSSPRNTDGIGAKSGSLLDGKLA